MAPGHPGPALDPAGHLGDAAMAMAERGLLRARLSVPGQGPPHFPLLLVLALASFCVETPKVIRK